jgi:hypothetical protein
MIISYIKQKNIHYVAVDAPFHLPEILVCKDPAPLYLPENLSLELQNPYIYDNDARFLYEKTGLKPMPNAADRIGRLTARMQHIQQLGTDSLLFAKGIDIPIYNGKPILFECYPKILIQHFVKKVPPYKKEGWKKYKSELCEMLKKYINFDEHQVLNDDLFDAIITVLSAKYIIKNGFLGDDFDSLMRNYFRSRFIYIPKVGK